MNYSFRFAYPWVLALGVIILLFSIIVRRFFHKPVIYRYSLSSLLLEKGYGASWLPFKLLALDRLLLLGVLALIAARPQLVDVQSKIPVEGIDIMLVLDASGSMQCFDDLQDQRSRFEVAKTEAIHFAERRENDQIGGVIFGKDAVSRWPLTLDKKIIVEIIKNLEIGSVNPDGTVLSVAIAMAARRLQQSTSKTKIMIVLTDGEPTPGIDIDPQIAINLAKKLGIKIYTIGVGGEHGGMWRDPIFGIRAMGFKLNSALLKTFAQETGGHYFEAHHPQELQQIYATIDQLEKTEHEATIFSTYYELFIPFLIAAFCLLAFEWFVRIIWVRV